MRYSDEQIACVVHEMIRGLQIVQSDPAPADPWLSASDAMKRSAVEGVVKARQGLSPRQLHDEWVQYMAAQGWVWGPRKDFDDRTHPCMVPYDDLPPGQRVKDELFLAVVAILAGEL